MKITFHKAIDETVNIFEEIEKLVNYKILQAFYIWER